MKLRITFRDCKDEGTMQRCLEDLKRSGAGCLESRLKGSGVGVVLVEISDPAKFHAEFMQTTSAALTGLPHAQEAPRS